MNNRAILITIVFFVGTLMLPSSLHAYSIWYSPYGNSYIPAPMYADPAGNPQYPGTLPALKTGAKTWNQEPSSYFAFSMGGFYSGPVPLLDDHNQNAWGTNDPGVLAVSYLVENGPDREVDVRFTINPSPYSWNIGPDPTLYYEIDLQSVATHEFGHNLGLGHSTISAAVMWPYIDIGSDSKRVLNADDIAGIYYLYPNLQGDGAMGSTLNGLPAGLELKVSNAGNNAQISFSMPNAATANVKICDATGRVVQTIVDANLGQGEHTYNWNTNNLNAGVYFVSVETASENATAKFVVVR